MADPRDTDTRQQDGRCLHADQQLRRRVVSNGVAHFVLQCQRCGIQTRAVGPNDPLRKALKEVPPDWDDLISARYWDERFTEGRERWAAANEEREAERLRWRERYERYMRSPEWRAKADARLAMDQYRCGARMAGCTGQATQVHHLSYRHLENEPLFELVSVCRTCHAQITEMDRPKAQDTGYAAAD